MVGCSIRNCKSRSVKGGDIRFFSFPAKESVAKEWLRLCGPHTTAKNGRICSKHFLPTDFNRTLKHFFFKQIPEKVGTLLPDVVPTQCIDDVDLLFIPNEDNDGKKPSKDRVEIEILENIKTEPIDYDEYEVAGSSGEPRFGRRSDADATVTISLAEHKQLQKTAKKFQILQNNCNKMFTSGQVRCLMKPGMRRVRWSAEDIASAILLRKRIGAKAYGHLRTKVGIPLPAFTTLRQWTSKYEIVLLKNRGIGLLFRAKKS